MIATSKSGQNAEDCGGRVVEAGA